MRCILWAEFADQLLQYVEAINEGPYFVILQFAKTQHNYGQFSNHNSPHYI